MYFQLVSTLLLIYIGTLTLYRLYFHPLRKYPGPLLAALTDWYELYYNIVKGGALVTEIEKLHKFYGRPVIRIGPNTLHFNDRRAYHDIYTNGSAFVKEPGFYLSFIAHASQGLLATCDPGEARIQKSLLGPLFSRRAVLALESTIQVDQLIALIQDHYSSQDSGFQMNLAYRSVAMDLITKYCFAQSADTLVPGFRHPTQRSIEDFFKRIWFERHFPFLTGFACKMPRTLVGWLLPRFKSYIDMKAALEHQIDRLKRNPDLISLAEHETIYHRLLNPKNQVAPSRKMLVDQAFTLIGAGSDTIGNVCTVGTFYALKNGSISQKLTMELYEAWPDGSKPLSLTTLEKLPYLTAFIKEALRFSIGVIHPMPRQANTTEEIAGYQIPPGTIVEMSTVFLHMNPDVFRKPYTFDPDRWLTEDADKMNQDFAPFSKGPRMCIGLNLAWCELYLILGNMFRKLNMKLHDREIKSSKD
ncbi:cytochrome P450 [Lentinula raphanica]|nr:cytochrome P450 [Lentinula raphanica]